MGNLLPGTTVEITDTNLKELQRLCEEFCFDEFSAKLSARKEASQKQQIGVRLLECEVHF
jgi:hypothetical protein